MQNRFFAVFVVLMFGFFVQTTPAFAQSAIDTEVVLEITSANTEQNCGKTIVFNRAMLKLLPAVQITTSTIWTDGIVKFKGVRLMDVVKISGFSGSVVTGWAINDYGAEFPLDDPTTNDAVIAYEMNDQEMSPRDKGPLWIIYPYDTSSEFQNETIFARSVWQLNRLEIE